MLAGLCFNLTLTLSGVLMLGRGMVVAVVNGRLRS